MVNGHAVGVRHGVVHKSHTVAHFKPHAGGNDGIITVIRVPVRHIRSTRAKAALTQAVGVKFRVESGLRIARAHDYLEKVFHNRTGDKPVSLPALAALAGVCSESRCT